MPYLKLDSKKRITTSWIVGQMSDRIRELASFVVKLKSAMDLMTCIVPHYFDDSH